jgi:hypothetical protein
MSKRKEYVNRDNYSTIVKPKRRRKSPVKKEVSQKERARVLYDMVADCKFKEAKKLIKKGVDINMTLMLASSWCGNEKVADYLVDIGACYDEALTLATTVGCCNGVIETLIQKGADKKIQQKINYDNYTRVIKELKLQIQKKK